MDREAHRLLPGHAELARRAAGGDGAAFVRLYDAHAADVFEAALEASGSVEAATDATQTAFLTLLRRPPALAASDEEVADRLAGLAIHAAGLDPDAIEIPVPRRRFQRSVGWLRSETVAKAGARFDADWSHHLAAAAPPAHTTERVRARAARPHRPVMPASAGTLTSVTMPRSAEHRPPEEPRPRVPEREPVRTPLALPTLRRPGVGRLTLPRPRVALPALPRPRAIPTAAVTAAVAAAGLGAAVIGGASEDAGDVSGGIADAMGQGTATAAEQQAAPSAAPEPARGRTRTGGAVPAAAAVQTHDPGRELAGPAPAAPDRANPGTGTGRQDAGTPPPGGARLRVGAGTPDAGSGGPRLRAPAQPEPPTAAPAPTPADPAPAPAPEPQPEPPPAPSEPAPAETEPTAGPMPGSGAGGANRNCNSRRSADPC